MASSIASRSLLPYELVENILYKVPVECLVRFKSTCKQWCALLNDSRFIYKHLELSREGLIRVHDHKLYQYINLETLALSSLQGPSNIYSMIHCDGLLLCQFKSDNIDRNLAIWNPFLSLVKWIKLSISYTGHWDIYGFGYDNLSRENYKILRFCNKLGYEETEIYEFKTKLWRSVDYSCAYSWYAWYDEAVSMDGNMYWFVKRDKENSQTENFILCFDFSREIFKETCCLPFINCDDVWLLPHLSGFRGDRLSKLSKDKYGKIQVWVTNKVTDEVVSWSKYFNVTPQYLSIVSRESINNTTFFIHKTNRIMLWCKEEDVKNKDIYVHVYEICEGVVEKLVETGRHRRGDKGCITKIGYIFVPSLVPVPE
ncbi:hypothetical protein Bca4012_049374 [Brassica carinata]|uniref:F-box domain-containing protein n=3 Tax=Brassica TaxID=3705 RepID=A0A0D3AN53_BRAOL|nr:hypothetical protein Bca52824_052145 [Brassica carinata]VDD21991.1 unnamed protein product [Brassica oleracea]